MRLWHPIPLPPWPPYASLHPLALSPIDEPQRPLTSDATASAAGPEAAAPASDPSRRHAWRRVALIFVVALSLSVLAYLALAVPGAWFPSAAPRTWEAGNLALTRGSGVLNGGELVVTAPDATGLTLVSLVAKFRSTDYPAVAWVAIGIPESADVRLLWSSDYAPQTLRNAPIRIEAGRLLPVLLAADRGWVGNITGLALSIQGSLAQPVHIRGVVAKPMGAVEILGDRAREWLAFESWTGTSINTITGGADIQDLSLPVLLAGSVTLAVAIGYLLRRFAPRWLPLPIATVLVALFVAASLVLDARWTLNLVRQVRATGVQYAGKDTRDKHLASDDAPLFGFVEKARKVLPEAPARVFVIADAPYFRDRAAYHLYPHNVFFDPLTNSIPSASTLRPGDWLVVYQRRGIQYSPAERRLRWEGGQSVAAESKLVDSAGALFQIQ